MLAGIAQIFLSAICRSYRSADTAYEWQLAADRCAQAAEAGCRFALGHIIDRSLALVEYLRKKGPKAVHNMDTLLLRESMDVIGEVFCLPEQLPAQAACHRGVSQGKGWDGRGLQTLSCQKCV